MSTGSDTEPLSGSTDEVSDSEEERQNREAPAPIPSADFAALLNASQPASLVTPPLQESSVTGSPSSAALACSHSHAVFDHVLKF